jgi:sodium/potassium-transporting ATPase subunit alpha
LSPRLHQTPIEAFAAEKGTKIDMLSPKDSGGLTEAEAALRLERDGPNVFTQQEGRPAWLKFLLLFTDPFMLLLIIAGILSFIAYAFDTKQPINLYLGILLEAVTFLSCVYSFLQEGKATSAMESFKSMLPKFAFVIRDGTGRSVPASNLVVGDVIRVATGDQVPADARVFFVQDLKLEMSSLTGEPNAISRSLNATEDRDIEAANLLFNTAQCHEGEGYAIVYATGDQTFIGRIAQLASNTKEVETPMQKEVLIFVKRLGVVALTMACIFFIIGFARIKFTNWIPPFVNGFIVVAVACVPEGLPMTVVSCLSVASKRMAEEDCYVKQLSSVETLGSVNLICSDKTGTLTQNKMVVANFFFDLYRHVADAMNETLPVHQMRRETVMPTFAYIEAIMGVCNRERFADEHKLTDVEADYLDTMRNLDTRATLQRQGHTQRVQQKLDVAKLLKDDAKRESGGGDASERAMFQFVAPRQSIELMRFDHRVEFEVPFNSKNKFSVSVASFIDPATKQPRKVLMMKGAPERVLKRCNTFMFHGKPQPIDAAFTQKYEESYDLFGNNGERVLGFAVIELAADSARFTSENWPQARVE